MVVPQVSYTEQREEPPFVRLDVNPTNKYLMIRICART